MKFLQFFLTIPPSVNKIWRKSRHGGMHRSQNYSKWISLSRITLKTLEVPEWDGPVEVTIVIHGGKSWRSNRDIDNVPKGILDAMVLEGILVDDNCEIVQRLIIEYRPPEGRKTDAVVEITVRELGVRD